MVERIERQSVHTLRGGGWRTRTTESAEPAAPAGVVLLARIVYWLLGAAEALLATRFVLVLLGANQANAFAHFVLSVSAPLARPFFSLFGYEPAYGVSHVELGTIAAMIVYAVVGIGIVAALRLPRRGNDV